MEVYPYLDHSGTLAAGQTGYETTLELPASVMYNFFGYEHLPPGPLTVYQDVWHVCYWQPDSPPYESDYSPHSNRNNGNQPTIQVFDSVRGWLDFIRIIDLCAAYRPTSSYGYYGLGHAFFPAPPGSYHIENPTRWRITRRGLPWLEPVMSWVHVNLGLSDQCRSPEPAQPEVHLGYAETTLFLDSRAPRQRDLGRLPNGAPLAGRNRVQLIG
jgi:hypothetical protein